MLNILTPVSDRMSHTVRWKPFCIRKNKNMKKTIIWIGIVLIILIIGLRGCNGYNDLIKADENVANTWNNVQSAYQRRADLIPT